MYESRSEPLLSVSQFSVRLATNFAAATILVAASLAVGMLGYRYFEGLSWVDGYLNSAMLLSGMGPLANPQSFGGKVFAATYALYCGLLALVTATLVLAPVFHRVLHTFHLVDEAEA